MQLNRWFEGRRAAYVIGVCIALGLAAAAQAESQTLRLRADQWMPFNGDPAGDRPGYVVELARIIFNGQGTAVDYQTMPWPDALKAAATGEIDGVIGANATEAKGLQLPAECIGLPRVGLFVRKDNPFKYTSIHALKDVRLGVIEGYSYWPVLDEYLKKQSAPAVVTFSGETPLKDGIAKLDAGEIDIMAETFTVWVWTLEQSGRTPNNYRVLCLQTGDPIFVAFAPGESGRQFAQQWDTGLSELRRNGKLAEIVKKYGLSDWQESK